MKLRSGATIENTDWSRGRGSDSSRSSGRREDKGIKTETDIKYMLQILMGEMRKDK